MSVGLLEVPSYVAGTWTIDPAHSDAGFVITYTGPIPGGGVTLSEKVRSVLEVEAVPQPG
ncbi:MAG TPA: hypothetical protein VH573_09445 [Mycobacteriales bacterium]|jgi:polyisoprenoid-binding protein YceI